MNTFAVDPTRTTQLRKRFVGAVNIRFRKIIALINDSVIDNDCFGLKIPSTEVFQENPQAIPRQRFKFATDAQKIDGFMQWFEDLVKIGIFEFIRGEYWFNPYLLEGYAKGAVWAQSNVKKAVPAMVKAGVTPPLALNVTAAQAIRGKFHMDALQALYTRAFHELKGVTGAMGSAISQALSEGLVEGENAAAVARRLRGRVNNIGKHRATLLARTEIIRAHHIATINRYEELEVKNVRIQAEWMAVKDGRVCSTCLSHDGKIYSLEQVRPMIPVHPNCRCTTKSVFDFID